LLPIDDFLPKIIEQLIPGKNLVLQAEPGAGKSTALPLRLLSSKAFADKKIVLLEPRRVAAKSIAMFLAKQLNESVGDSVGYHIKNERKSSSSTRLEIVTEGILTRRLQSDPEASEIGLIIFDEFHERSLHADLSLLLALEIQQTIRDDLSLLVMSATIDTAMIAAYMGGADIICCPGRNYPVSVQYTKPEKSPAIDRSVNQFNQKTDKRRLTRQVMLALKEAFSKSPAGDILVFLPGQADIKKAMTESESLYSSDSNLLFLPLYGGLPLAQQERALVPDTNGKRRVIFTTNIAETSLTIDGVTCVIDSGLERRLVYDPASSMTRLITDYISKASAQQRAGRAGRTQAGVCVRLWDESRQQTLRDYQGEEILSADLTGLLLELSLWGSADFDAINWLTPPPLAHYESAKNILLSLGLITNDFKITVLGERAVAMGLPPRLAAMLLQADSVVERAIAAELAVLLSDRDIFMPNSGTDIVARIVALQDYKNDAAQALKSYPLKRSSVQQLLLNAKSLARRLPSNKASSSLVSYPIDQLQSSVGRLLLCAYPDRLAKRRSNSCGRYQLANGRGVKLFEDDVLFGSEWLVVCDCDAQKQEGRIYTAAAINYDDMLDVLSDQFVMQESFQLDSQYQKVIGRKVTRYHAIEIQSVAINRVPPEKFQQCVMQLLNDRGLDSLNWTARCEDWLARAEWLGEQLSDFPKVSKQLLLASADQWLLPYISKVTSLAALKKFTIYDLLSATLSWDEQQLLNSEAPCEYKTPSGKVVRIFYDRQQGPTVSVVLQEMFGELASPRLAKGRVPIRFELLSPARRPIQTTSDLANFWQSSYFDVAKDMKGRYPKHRWPEQPLLEKPGRSMKARKA
jgi:ATP-dependent helicase HrpB